MNNRQTIVNLLLAHGSLSRVDLAQAARLSKPTVSSVVAELITEGAIQEVGFGDSTGGRKPILLRLGGEGKLVVGVEIDARVCRLALVNLDGATLQQRDLAVADTAVERVLDLLAAGIDALFAGRDRRALIGCGVAVPGLIDTGADLVRFATGLGWTATPLRALLAARLGVPVMITDRGKAAALGELWFRGREKRDDLLYLYLGRGVGGAIVLGNALHLGSDHTAGEIGHMSIDRDGPLCKCGGRGCLETFVSSAAILAHARAQIAAGRRSPLATRLTDEQPEAAALAGITRAAADGDPLARELIEATAEYLGIAIANLVNVLNPRVIILGGPVARWGEPLIAATRREAARRALAIPFHTVQIVSSQAEEIAVPLGAAALVLKQAGELLAEPECVTDR